MDRLIYNKLLDIAENENIEIVDNYFNSNNLKGLYVNDGDKGYI